MTDFTNTESSREHQTKKGFKFKVRNRKKEGLHFFPGRDKRDIGIKPTEGNLVGIPLFVKNKYGEETQLGDTAIYRPVRKRSFFLDPEDEISHFLPGYIFRRSMNDIGKILKVCRDICRIRNNGMVGKTAKGEHLPKRI